jgi:hypothetical protein
MTSSLLPVDIGLNGFEPAIVVFARQTVAYRFRFYPIRPEQLPGETPVTLFMLINFQTTRCWLHLRVRMASGNNKDKKTVDAAMASKPSDRRIKERFPATCLSVQLSERGFFGRGKNPVAVNCLDMNRYGMAVQCPRPVEPGARLYLQIRGKYINEPRVAARVVRCQPWRTGFRVSVQFSYCLDQKRYSRAVDNALSRIEGFYSRLAG